MGYPGRINEGNDQRKTGGEILIAASAEARGILCKADEVNFLHLTPSGPALRPLLGIDFGRKDFADLSFGTRAIVWRDIMFFANGIFALNDDGLRNDTVIPTVGLEGTF